MANRPAQGPGAHQGDVERLERILGDLRVATREANGAKGDLERKLREVQRGLRADAGEAARLLIRDATQNWIAGTRQGMQEAEQSFIAKMFERAEQINGILDKAAENLFKAHSNLEGLPAKVATLGARVLELETIVTEMTARLGMVDASRSLGRVDSVERKRG